MKNRLSKIQETIQKNWKQALQWLQDQGWFQELKDKWEDLEPKHQLIAKVVLFSSVFLFFFSMFWSFLSSVSTINQAYTKKMHLLHLLEKTAVELKGMKLSKTAANQQRPNWKEYFQSKGREISLLSSQLTIREEKASKKTPFGQKAFFELNLKEINLKQLVRYAYLLETGPFPTHIQTLKVHTRDTKGYLNALLKLEAYWVKK